MAVVLLHPSLNIPTGLPNVEVTQLAQDVLCTSGPGLRSFFRGQRKLYIVLGSRVTVILCGLIDGH